MNWYWRLAELHDATALWQLRNHPSVRAQSLDERPIPLPDHYRWLSQALKDPLSRLWLASLTDTGSAFIAHVRLRQETGGAYLSWSLIPERQGQGLGRLLLQHWCQYHDFSIDARIKPDNHASQAVAQRAGFSRISTHENFDHWQRPGKPLEHLQALDSAMGLNWQPL
jgi:RimJ/RimL family protein N-acetyltransferase